MIVNLTIPFQVLSNILILPKIAGTTRINILVLSFLDFLSLYFLMIISRCVLWLDGVMGVGVGPGSNVRVECKEALSHRHWVRHLALKGHRPLPM